MGKARICFVDKEKEESKLEKKFYEMARPKH